MALLYAMLDKGVRRNIDTEASLACVLVVLRSSLCHSQELGLGTEHWRAMEQMKPLNSFLSFVVVVEGVCV